MEIDAESRAEGSGRISLMPKAAQCSAVVLVSLAAVAAADEWSAIDAGFAAPPAEFRLSQYSGHDGASLPVQQMAEAGIGGVKLFMQRDGYLQSEQAWANASNNIAAAKAAGLQLWMADDNGYPSGMAGGLVVEADPAHEARCLVEVRLDGRGRNDFSLALPSGAEKFVFAYLYPLVGGQPDLTRPRVATVQDGLVTGTGRSGDWTLRAYALRINNEGTQALSTAGQFQTSGRYPNLLSPAAMETFVSLTHEEYGRRLGPLTGQIDTFYSNEPNLMTLWWKIDPLARPDGVRFIPWDSGLSQRFAERHGYNLPPMLPALYGGDDTASKLVRRHFYETVGTVLAQNFSQRITDWGDQNGVRTAGHPLQEEDLYHHVIHYGDMFRFVEPMQIPAADLPMPIAARCGISGCRNSSARSRSIKTGPPSRPCLTRSFTAPYPASPRCRMTSGALSTWRCFPASTSSRPTCSGVIITRPPTAA
jgi:hypothetical protein